MADTNQTDDTNKVNPSTPVAESPKPIKTEASKYSLIKKIKFNKKLIPAILGVFFIVGAVAAGVVLVQQEQELREYAAALPCIKGNGSIGLCGPDKVMCPQGYKCTTNSDPDMPPVCQHNTSCCDEISDCYDKCICRGGVPSVCGEQCAGDGGTKCPTGQECRKIDTCEGMGGTPTSQQCGTDPENRCCKFGDGDGDGDGDGGDGGGSVCDTDSNPKCEGKNVGDVCDSGTGTKCTAGEDPDGDGKPACKCNTGDGGGDGDGGGGGSPTYCIIQGYKVEMPGNQKKEPAASQTVSVSGESKSTNAQPYSISNIEQGVNHTISVTAPTAPAGYKVGYTLCYNDVGCHGATPTSGSSVTINIPAKGPEDPYCYADLWWHFTSPTGGLACDSWTNVYMQKSTVADTDKANACTPYTKYESGDADCKTQSASVKIVNDVSSATHVRYENEPTLTTDCENHTFSKTFEPRAAVKTYTLPGSPGPKKVCAQFKDSAGNLDKCGAIINLISGTAPPGTGTPKPTPSPTGSGTPQPTPPSGKASVTLKFRMQGITSAKTDHPVNFKFRQGGTLKYTFAAVKASSNTQGIWTATLVKDKDGKFIDPGTYTILIKDYSHLQKKFTNVVVVAGTNTKTWTDSDENELMAGDVTGDNKITVDDVGQVTSDKKGVFKAPVTADNKQSDINQDGFITVADVALAELNWDSLTVQGDQ